MEDYFIYKLYTSKLHFQILVYMFYCLFQKVFKSYSLHYLLFLLINIICLHIYLNISLIGLIYFNIKLNRYQYVYLHLNFIQLLFQYFYQILIKLHHNFQIIFIHILHILKYNFLCMFIHVYIVLI